MCKCPICQSEFEFKSNKKYCSRNCKQKARRKPYLLQRKIQCDNCGFVAEHICQMDIDHIDGVHTNNSENNLQTLCANCHRLKSHINEDTTHSSYK